MEDVIRVVVMEPGQEPRLAITKNNYQGFQALVDGDFELAAHINEGRLSIYCNEDGVRRGLPDNIRIPWDEGKTAIIVGPVVVVRVDEIGEAVSLDDKDGAMLLDRFRLGGAYRV